MQIRPARIRGFDKIRRYAARMKRELLISFLPPVLLSVAIRLAAAANAIFRPDVSIGASQEWVLVLAVLAGAPGPYRFRCHQALDCPCQAEEFGRYTCVGFALGRHPIDEFR